MHPSLYPPLHPSSSPRLSLRKARAALSLLALLLPAALPAHAGSYTLTSQTGGVYCNDFSNHVETPCDPSHGCSGATGYSYVPSNLPGTPSAYCRGTITTTYTWNPAYPDEPAPTSVIVIEACTAKWSGYGSVASGGSCSDGLDDDEADTVNRSGSNPVSATGVSSGTHYKVMSGGSTVTVTCSPSATTAPGAGFSGVVEADVSYCVNISPVTVGLRGTTKDSSGSDNILIGQGCTASLDDIPTNYTYDTSDVAVTNYQWTVGGTTFQSWTGTTTPSSYVDGPGPLDRPTPHWYWNDLQKTPETVSCTATVTPPAGEGSPFTVTATKQVTVMVPGWTCTGTGGTMQVNTSEPASPGNYYLWAGPTAGSGETGGMDWNATVTSPNPALFGSGNIEIVQLVTPNNSYTAGATTHTWSLNGQTGLDTSYPYGWVTEAPNYFGGDCPGIALGTGVTSATEGSQFNDYLMYQPPGGQWVPLATFSWGTNGSATIPNPGGWAAFGSGSAGTVTPSGAPVPFTKSNTFPSWTQNGGNPPASSGHWQ